MRLFFDTIDQLIDRYTDDLVDDTLTSWSMAGQVYLIEADPGWSFRPYVIGNRSEFGCKLFPDSWFVTRSIGRVHTACGPLPETIRTTLREDDTLPTPEQVREAFAELSKPLTPAEVEKRLLSDLEAQARNYADIVERRRAEAIAAYRAGIEKTTVARAAGITRPTLDKWLAEAGS
jgi:hypothetical protein